MGDKNTKGMSITAFMLLVTTVTSMMKTATEGTMPDMTTMEVIKEIIDIGITPVLLLIFVCYFINKSKGDDQRVEDTVKSAREREDMLIAENAKREELLRQESEKRENMLRKEAEKRESMLMLNMEKITDSMNSITKTLDKMESSFSRVEKRLEKIENKIGEEDKDGRGQGGRS